MTFAIIMSGEITKKKRFAKGKGKKDDNLNLGDGDNGVKISGTEQFINRT